MTVLRASVFNRIPLLRFGISTRAGGASPHPYGMNLSYTVGDVRENVDRNREIFYSRLGLRGDDVAATGQVHGDTVLAVDAPGHYTGCDGLVSNAKNLFLAITVADCVPLFLADPETMAVGAVHAGWRGTQARIAAKAVSAMVASFGIRPDRLLAFIGPAASSCCYDVQEDVWSLFEERFRRRVNGRVFLDLKQANLDQLRVEGVLEHHIEVSPFCTISDAGLFHSHRRDGGKSGRMMGVIGATGGSIIR